MTFAPYLAHTEPIFISLELLPVEKIFINRVSIVMFKFSCNMLPDPIAKLYSKNKDYHSHNTKNKNHLKFPLEQRILPLTVQEFGILFLLKLMLMLLLYNLKLT